MKKESIFFTITITFVISLVFVLISFGILYKVNQKREKHFINKTMIDTTKMFLRELHFNGLTNDLKEDLKTMNFSLIIDKTQQNKILEDKNLKYLSLKHKEIPRVKLKYLKLNSKYYAYIQTPKETFILRNDNKLINHKNIIFGIYILILIAFTILYITVQKKLKPLTLLQQKVQGFGNEEFNIACASSKQDEISLLANEFDKSAKKLKNIKESRNVFIRNIMHELKTPITKGKFLTELPQTEENSEKMKKVFYRLESMISEFASIEELLSSKNILKTKEYYLEDIIDNSIDILMCDENQVVKDYENIKLDVDFKLFCIAIKNLLDNGIKYSTNNLVTVTVENKKIIFNSIGKRLQYPLESYFEPFFKGDDIKSNQSFGLGLYIIKHILDAHNYSLEYIYENSTNKFAIYKGVFQTPYS